MLSILWVAQATTPTGDLWDSFAALGIGALVAAPAWWGYWNERKKSSILEDEKNALYEAALKRERELSSGVVSVLGLSIDTMVSMPEKVRTALQDAQGAATGDKLEAMLKELRTLLADQRE